MALIAMLVVALVFIGVLYLIAQRGGLAGEAEDLAEELGGHAMTGIGFIRFHYRRFRPRLMAFGWLAVVLLALSPAAAFGLAVTERAPMWSFWVMLGFAFVGGLFVGWAVLRRVEASLLAVVIRSCIALGMVGFATVVVGCFARVGDLCTLGSVQTLAGVGIMWATARLLAEGGVQLINFGESFADAFLRLFRLMAALAQQGLEALLPSHFEIARQEDFLPDTDKFFKNRVVAPIAPFLVGSITFFHWLVLPIVGALTLATPLMWVVLESVKIRTGKLKKRSARIWVLVMTVCLALSLGRRVLVEIEPGLAAGLDHLLQASLAFLVRELMLIVLFVASSVALYFVWPENGEARLSGFRKVLGVPIGLVSLASAGILLWGLFQARAEVLADTAASGVIMHFIPNVRASTSMDGKPSAKVNWPNVPDAVAYRIERRELHEPDYTPLKKSAASEPYVFAKGVTSFEDTPLEEGRTYFYRVVSVNAEAKKRESSEVAVSIAAVSITKAPPPAASGTPSTSQKPVASRSKHAASRSKDLQDICAHGACD